MAAHAGNPTNETGRGCRRTIRQLRDPADGAEPLACEAGAAAPPVIRALLFIEGHLTEDVCLDDIAAAAGLTRFQMCRTFVAATGISVMHYVRGRRLTEAARVLACGASDILTVAMSWGYGSHEAFTRAFCSRFGITPERLRARGTLDGVSLTQALVTGDTRVVELARPRVLESEPLLVAGMRQRYTGQTNQAIPMLWHRFVRRLSELPHRTGAFTYGLCCNNDREGGFEYVAGMAVHSIDGLPADFVQVRLPARRYAVFVHRGHISGIRATMHSIWAHYLPSSTLRVIEAPDFERYTGAFNSRTGDGDVEIWIPVG